MKPCLIIGSLIVGSAFAASGATAQTAPEEITVTGQYGTDNVQSLSQTVSYADLDLSTSEGKSVLRQRLKLTARWLCQKLGEPETASPPAPSCRDAAVSDAMARVGTIEEKSAPRGTTWAAGSPWSAPYPADWYKKYP